MLIEQVLQEIGEPLNLDKMNLVRIYKQLGNTPMIHAWQIHKRFVWMTFIRNHLRIRENPNLKRFEEIKDQPHSSWGQYGLKEHLLYLYNDENQCWHSA